MVLVKLASIDDAWLVGVGLTEPFCSPRCRRQSGTVRSVRQAIHDAYCRLARSSCNAVAETSGARQMPRRNRSSTFSLVSYVTSATFFSEGGISQ